MEHSHLHKLKHQGFTHYDDIETALRKFFTAAKLSSLPSEEIPLREAAGRILGKDIEAASSLPPYNKSLVDGYALRSSDTSQVSAKNQAKLKIIAKQRFKSPPRASISGGECVWVPTGGFLPKGADAVVMFEEVKVSRNQIQLHHPSKKDANVVRAGLDVKKGQLLFRRGQRLHWFELGLLAALNQRTVCVVRKPRIAVLSTGDELTELGGKGIPDSNRYALLSAIESCGAKPIDLGIVPDNLNEIVASLQHGLKTADMITITGGSSVGKMDLVPEAVSKLGKPGLIVHGIAMRPGSPTGLGAIGGNPILILPGLPISALIGFYILGQRILARLTNASDEALGLGTVRGRMMEDVEASKGMESFRPVRIKLKGSTPLIYPIKPYGSSIISSIARADGIVTVPSKSGELRKDETVSVDLLRPIRAKRGT